MNGDGIRTHPLAHERDAPIRSRDAHKRKRAPDSRAVRKCEARGRFGRQGFGEKLSTETLKKLTQGMTTYLLDTLKSLGKRKPGQNGLRERIAQSLEGSPLARSRSALDSEAVEQDTS